jgi:hypothetical protein
VRALSVIQGWLSREPVSVLSTVNPQEKQQSSLKSAFVTGSFTGSNRSVFAIAPIEMSNTQPSTPVFIEPTDTRTATASQVATSGLSEGDPLSNPDTSKIVKVTIACAIMVLLVTGAVAGFKVSFGTQFHSSSFV